LKQKKLKNESGGSSSKLTIEQTEELINHLEINTYPDTKEIIAYVQKTYVVKYYLDNSIVDSGRIHLIADGGGVHTCKEVGVYLGIKDPFNRKYLKNEYQINKPSNKKTLTKRFIKELKLVMNKEPELFIDKTIFDNRILFYNFEPI